MLYTFSPKLTPVTLGKLERTKMTIKRDQTACVLLTEDT